MSLANQRLLAFSDVRQELGAHRLRLAEIPIAHSLSLPLPTLRWGSPAYAFFATARLRRPERAQIAIPPDSWGLLDPQNGHLLLYARWATLPILSGVDATRLVPATAHGEFAALQQEEAALTSLLDRASSAYLGGQDVDRHTRHALVTRFARLADENLVPYYQALVPDFFRWLTPPG